MATRGGDDSAGAPEPARPLRGLLVTLAAVGLCAGVLASLPAAKVTSAPVGTTTTTTSTTVPAGGSSTSTTTAASGAAVHVAILAPAGSTTEAAVADKLAAAHDVLVRAAPIPLSWVSGLAGPVIHYPSGEEAAAAAVAKTLGVPTSGISLAQPGTTVGADVVEVFLPAG